MFFKKHKNKIGPLIFYICDQKACENCRYPECKKTSNINHAVSFRKEEGHFVEIKK